MQPFAAAQLIFMNLFSFIYLLIPKFAFTFRMLICVFLLFLEVGTQIKNFNA